MSKRSGQCWGESNMPEGATVRSRWRVTQEMVDNISAYVEFVKSKVDGGVLMVERRLGFGEAIGKPGEFGTMDAGVISKDGKTLRLFDLKYGRGYVSAEGNTQQMLYGLGVVADYDMIYDLSSVEKIVLCIYQPRIGNISEWETTPEYMTEFAERAKQAIARSEEALVFFETPNLQYEDIQEWSKEYLVPTEKGCQWCKAKRDNACPALAAMNVGMIVAPASDDLLTDLDAVMPETGAELVSQVKEAILGIPSLDIATAAKLYSATKPMKEWIEAVETSMYVRLMNGEVSGEYKLVKGRAGDRAWADPETAEAAMKAMRLKLDEMYDKKIISPTKAEALLDKKRPKLWAKLQEHITRSEGKITVAPMKDKREAIVLEPVLDMLPDLSDVIEGEVISSSTLEQLMLENEDLF